MTNEFIFKNSGIISKGLTIYNARCKPFRMHGLYKPQEPGVFKRIPLDVAEKTSKNVKTLHTNTAGARLRFKTDSSYIAVGAIYPKMEFPSPCSTALSSAGGYSFDLYADNKFCRVLWPKDIVQNGSINNFVIHDGQYEGSYDFGEKKMREITLCFPSFVDISDVYIGLKEESRVYDLYLSSSKTPDEPPTIMSELDMQIALTYDYWDIVVMQDGVFDIAYSGNYTLGHSKALQEFANKNRMNTSIRFAWHMTWVAPTDNTLRDDSKTNIELPVIGVN